MLPELKRTFLKRILIVIPLSSDNLTSTLSPILGQYGIVVSEFIEKLNQYTWFLERDLVVRVSLVLYSTNLYTFDISYLTGYSLFRVYRTETHLPLPAIDFYKAVFLYSYLNTRFNKKYLRINFLNFKAYQNSWNVL